MPVSMSYLNTSDLPDDNTPHSVDSVAPYVTGKGIVLFVVSKSVTTIWGLLLPVSGQFGPVSPESHWHWPEFGVKLYNVFIVGQIHYLKKYSIQLLDKNEDSLFLLKTRYYEFEYWLVNIPMYTLSTDHWRGLFTPHLNWYTGLFCITSGHNGITTLCLWW